MLGQIEKSERSAAATESRREKMRRARDMYRVGWRLVEIAAEIGVPPGTVRRWKCVHRWADEAEEAKGDDEESESACSAPLYEEISTVLGAPALTGKQRLFALYYAKSYNAARSYQKVYGCSYTSALARGPVLAGKPEIQNAVRRVREQLASHAFLTSDDIFQKFIEIAFSDITDFVEFEGDAVRLRPSFEVDGSLLEAVSCGEDGVKVKLLDRLKALKWLGEHLDLATDEQRAQVEKLQAETRHILGSSDGLDREDDPITQSLKKAFHILDEVADVRQMEGENGHG